MANENISTSRGKRIFIDQLPREISDNHIMRAVSHALKGQSTEGRVVEVRRTADGVTAHLDSEECVDILLETGLHINGVRVNVNRYRDRGGSGRRDKPMPRRGRGMVEGRGESVRAQVAANTIHHPEEGRRAPEWGTEEPVKPNRGTPRVPRRADKPDLASAEIEGWTDAPRRRAPRGTDTNRRPMVGGRGGAMQQSHQTLATAF